MITLLLVLACGSPDCVPLDQVPLTGPWSQHDDLAIVREQLVTAGSWFQVEPCVAEVIVVVDTNSIAPSEQDTRGVYQSVNATIYLEPEVPQSVVTHELCHAYDNDHRDVDGWWLSDQNFEAFDQVTLAGCHACESFDRRINETFAQYCDLGPQPVRLGESAAAACPDNPGPTDVDRLIADAVFILDDSLDPAVELAPTAPAGVLVQPVHAIDGFHLARVGSGAFYAVISLLPDPSPWLDLRPDVKWRQLSDQATPDFLARVDPWTGETVSTRPWAWRDEVQEVQLSGGDPLVAWGLDIDGWVRHAWAVDTAGGTTALRGVGGLRFADAAGLGDRLLLARQEEGGVELAWFELETGLEQPLLLDDGALAGATLVSLRAHEGGALLAVTRDRFGEVSWLDQDGSVVRRASFPGAWPVHEVLALGDGLALRWTIDVDAWTSGVTAAMSGYATWQPGQDWTVNVAACDARMWALGVLDGDLVGEWRSYGEEDWPRRVGVLP